MSMQSGRVVGVQRGDEDRARAKIVHRFDRIARRAQGTALTLAEIIEFELVGRDDIGCGHGFLAHEFGNALAHKNAAPDVADHRVAAISGRRIGALEG